KVSNNSYGGGSAYAPMQAAIAAARAAGHIFVTAAGNDGTNNDVVPSYPGNYPEDNILSVASTDRNDRLAASSNYGAATVQLAAPGASILSTLPGGRYGTYSGTSMATAFVAGAVALVWDLHPDWSYDRVIRQVVGTTDSLSSLTGKVASGGR